MDNDVHIVGPNNYSALLKEITLENMTMLNADKIIRSIGDTKISSRKKDIIYDILYKAYIYTATSIWWTKDKIYIKDDPIEKIRIIDYSFKIGQLDVDEMVNNKLIKALIRDDNIYGLAYLMQKKVSQVGYIWVPERKSRLKKTLLAIDYEENRGFGFHANINGIDDCGYACACKTT